MQIAASQDQWQRERLVIGRVESSQSSDLGFELGGTVLDVMVDEGDLVTAGDPLARIDNQRLQASAAEVTARLEQAKAGLAELEAGTREEVVEQARARLNIAKAQRDLAAADHARSNDLRASESISAQTFDQTAAALAVTGG